MKTNLMSRFLLLVVTFVLTLTLAACSGNSLDGHYVGDINGESYIVDIEGDAAVLSLDYSFMHGVVDKENKVIHLNNEIASDYSDDYTYDFVNGNLVITTTWGDSIKLTKEDKTKKITSIPGNYSYTDPDYYTYLVIRDDDALFASNGIGNTLSFSDNVLTDEKREDSYNISTVYGAMLLDDGSYYRYCFYEDQDAEKTEGELAAFYEIRSDFYEPGDDIMSLEVDASNNKAILTMYGEDIVGEVDPVDKKMHFGNYINYDYDLFGDKLILGEKDLNSYMVLEPVDSAHNQSAKASAEKNESAENSMKEEEKKEYRFSGDHDNIPLGEYMVGTDIKPGTYTVEFEYMNFDDEDAQGSGTVIFYKDGSEVSRKEFSDLEEKSIVFEEGMKVEFSSDAEESEFILYSN